MEEKIRGRSTALNVLDQGFALASDMLDREARILDGRYVTEAVLDISHRSIAQFAHDLQEPVAKALTILEESFR